MSDLDGSFEGADPRTVWDQGYRCAVLAVCLNAGPSDVLTLGRVMGGLVPSPVVAPRLLGSSSDVDQGEGDQDDSRRNHPRERKAGMDSCPVTTCSVPLVVVPTKMLSKLDARSSSTGSSTQLWSVCVCVCAGSTTLEIRSLHSLQRPCCDS